LLLGNTGIDSGRVIAKHSERNSEAREGNERRSDDGDSLSDDIPLRMLKFELEIREFLEEGQTVHKRG
jgi:hypothetical protein